MEQLRIQAPIVSAGYGEAPSTEERPTGVFVLVALITKKGTLR